jgi:Putative Flp pilus-assembly TadE/G-like
MRTNGRTGFTLIASGICVASLFGMLGLAVDLGRVLITKNETQSFTDTAAMAAVLKLNGLSFTAARNAVTNNTKNQWNMGTAVFTASGGATTITTEFAKPQLANDFKPNEATWSANPATAAGYTFVRVTATATLPLYVLPVVGASSAQLVKTLSVAGQVPDFTFNKGLLPYSPLIHSERVAANPPFGYEKGKWYTLRYSSGATVTESDLCPGDKIQAGEDPAVHQAFVNLASSAASNLRGFYQDSAASVITAEIVDGYMRYPVDTSCTGKLSPPCGFITMYGGAKNQTTESALGSRIDFDTDNVSRSYEEYEANIVNGEIVGNGFRLVGVPVNLGPGSNPSDPASRQVAGFAGFFLSASSTNVYYSGGGGQSYCAEYYGTWSKDAQGAGPGKEGLAYVSLLIQ